MPESFREMPRWWHDEPGRLWLDALPTLIADQCRRWDLHLEGAGWHGSNALVLPVSRGGVKLALRMVPPEDDVSADVAALRFWDGDGTVKLVDADLAHAAMLLERLNPLHSLAMLPLADAVAIIASCIRRLARPAPPHVASTASSASACVARFPCAWRRLGEPTPARLLHSAVSAAACLAERPPSRTAVNGDLHYDQVLAGEREPWLVVDPLLMRGDLEYDVARLLWSRLDEMPGDDDVVAVLDTIVARADLTADLARAWVVTRSMDYLLWGLDRGLTIDPRRCLRLLQIFA